MTTCWSDVLGDCGGGQSEEHYLSRSIIGNSTVTISGFPFLDGKTRTLPGKRLTRNMLCKRHNESLSPLDAAAGHFFQVIKAFMHRGKMRARGARKPGGLDIYRVDGALTERWMLKTVINMMFRRRVSTGAWRPRENWVRCVHGMEAFAEGCGLYLLTAEGRLPDRSESAIGIRFLTQTETDHTLIGAQFSIEDLQFAVTMVAFDWPHRGGYRFRELKDKPSLDLRLLIHVDWKGLAPSG